MYFCTNLVGTLRGDAVVVDGGAGQMGRAGGGQRPDQNSAPTCGAARGKRRQCSSPGSAWPRHAVVSGGRSSPFAAGRQVGCSVGRSSGAAAGPRRRSARGDLRWTARATAAGNVLYRDRRGIDGEPGSRRDAPLVQPSTEDRGGSNVPAHGARRVPARHEVQFGLPSHKQAESRGGVTGPEQGLRKGAT